MNGEREMNDSKPTGHETRIKMLQHLQCQPLSLSGALLGDHCAPGKFELHCYLFTALLGSRGPSGTPGCPKMLRGQAETPKPGCSTLLGA